jgi:acetyltransferase-like isoleucine patch superfamily enzyme
MLLGLVDYAVRRYHDARHRLHIGDDAQIRMCFSVATSVTIGNRVLIGSNVAIRDHDHRSVADRQRARWALVAEPVQIGVFDA